MGSFVRTIFSKPEMPKPAYVVPPPQKTEMDTATKEAAEREREKIKTKRKLGILRQQTVYTPDSAMESPDILRQKLG